MVRTQSEATINCIVNYCKEKEIEAQPFETKYSDVLDKSDLKAIQAFVFKGLQDKTITMTEKARDKFETEGEKSLMRYVVGLVNDRLRKAKALNGNITYEPKEPGKLKDARDPQLKALTQVLALETTSDEDKEVITEAIKARKAELNVEKTVTINPDDLPADIRARLNL